MTVMRVRAGSAPRRLQASTCSAPTKSVLIYCELTALSAVQKRCTSEHDVGAYLAAVRLRDAAQATLDGQQVALAPLRAAVRARRNP